MPNKIQDIIDKFKEEFFVKDGTIPTKTYVKVEQLIKSSLTSLLDSLEKEVKYKEYDKHNPWCECLEDENMPCDCGVSHHNVLL